MAKIISPNCPKCERVLRYITGGKTHKGQQVRYYDCQCSAAFKYVEGKLLPRATTRGERVVIRDAVPGARVYIDGKFVGIGGKRGGVCSRN